MGHLLTVDWPCFRLNCRMCPNIWGIGGFICCQGGEGYQHGNDPNLQCGNFVSVGNAPAAPASLSQILMRLSQGRHKTFLTSHQVGRWPSPRWHAIARDTQARPKAPSFPQKSPALLPGLTGRTHHIWGPHWHQNLHDWAATKHTGLSMAHGSTELSPSPVSSPRGEGCWEKELSTIWPCLEYLTGRKGVPLATSPTISLYPTSPPCCHHAISLEPGGSPQSRVGNGDTVYQQLHWEAKCHQQPADLTTTLPAIDMAPRCLHRAQHTKREGGRERGFYCNFLQSPVHSFNATVEVPTSSLLCADSFQLCVCLCHTGAPVRY